MAEVSELEELFQAFAEFSARLGVVEEVLQSTKALDHKGIAMVASEGLAGGGTIDKSRGFRFDYPKLTPGRLAKADEIFCIFSPSDGEHQQIPLVHLVDRVVQLSGLPEKIDGLKQEIKRLEEKVALFSIYERLYLAETQLKELREKLDEREAQTENEGEVREQAVQGSEKE